jgi:hypothetical protein
MRAATVRCVGVSVAIVMLALRGTAQEHASTNDPRVGLKAGFHDAGEAARNLERIATLPKPEGFVDTRNPADAPIPPEPEPSNGRGANPPGAESATPPGSAGNGAAAGRGRTQIVPWGLNFANSDLAFRGHDVFVGNFHGFNTYDIENTRRPQLIASIVCPGGQGDVSIYGNLLFMSVEQTRSRVDCGTQGVQAPVSSERFRGVRIFDISNLERPRQIAAVQTCRGSHTHTLVIDPNDKGNIYIYGSGTAGVRSGDELAGCSNKDPKDDPNTSLFSIDIIQVPLARPETASIVNKPRIFADEKIGAMSGLWQGGNYGPGTQTSRVTSQCHDITAYPEVGLAAGACAGNGILLDIRDPVHPVRLDAVGDKNFAYWHSATFNDDGTKVIFTDEWGGGTRPRCRAVDPINWGADAIFDIVDRKLQFRSYYKMPAVQTELENCVAHNGSLVPVPGRDILVQGWYQGGISVFDFTDSAHPIEIAFFDRGPVDATTLVLGGYWSAYWYNGHIYGSEIARGIDIFVLKPSQYLSQNEIDAAALVRLDELNVQGQRKNTWPGVPVVARAYLDQLNRSRAIPAARARAVRSALDRARKARNSDKDGATIVRELDAIAAQLDRDAGAASGIDARRLSSLAETIRGCAANLRRT